MNQKYKLILSSIFLLVFFTLVCITRKKKQELSKSGSIATAYVYNAMGSNYEYRYIVHGVIYTKKQSKQSNRIKDGQTYTLYYDPQDPAFSTIDISEPILIDSVFNEK